jgi:hypothetical protein
MHFFKVQSNRAKIKQLLNLFEDQFVKGEHIVAPRPKAGSIVQNYFAFVSVKESSPCFDAIQKIKNCVSLSENDFKHEVENIVHSWTAGDIS